MKMKDLRGYLFTLLLIILDIVLLIHSMQSKNKMKMILAILIIPSIFLGIFTQFMIRVLNDSILVYRFIGIIAIPSLLEYKDISSLELVSNIKIMIISKGKKYPIYVLNAKDKYNKIREKYDEAN